MISVYRAAPRDYTVLVIHPAALPREAGVLIGSDARHRDVLALLIGLVKASPACTGS